MTSLRKHGEPIQCSDCKKPLSRNLSKTGLCGTCYHAAKVKPPRFCVDCNKPIGRHTKSGLCLQCSNHRRELDPAFAAKRTEGIRRKFQEPEHLEKMRKVMTRNMHKAYCDPVLAEKRREHGKFLAAAVLRRPDVIAKMESRRAFAGKQVSETRLAWCPPHYREQYRKLTVSKRLHAAEAKEKILALVEADKFTALVTMDNMHSAIFHLRRLTSITKRGEKYLVGTAELEPWQVVKRALDKGWQPPFEMAA